MGQTRFFRNWFLVTFFRRGFLLKLDICFTQYMIKLILRQFCALSNNFQISFAHSTL